MLKSTFSYLQRCLWQYGSIFIRLAVVAFQICEIRRNFPKFKLNANKTRFCLNLWRTLIQPWQVILQSLCLSSGTTSTSWSPTTERASLTSTSRSSLVSSSRGTPRTLTSTSPRTATPTWSPTTTRGSCYSHLTASSAATISMQTSWTDIDSRTLTSPHRSAYRTLMPYCCHMGTAIKHPVPDRVKPSFVIFDIRALWRPGLSVRVPGCQKLQMTA